MKKKNAAQTEIQQNKPVKPKKVGRFLRGKRKHTSMYFLLWTIFSLLSLTVIILFGVTQHIMITQVYEEELAKGITRKGQAVHSELLQGVPDDFNYNYSGYIRFLGAKYDVQVWILDAEGRRIFPQEQNIDPNNPHFEEHFDFSAELIQLKAALSETGNGSAVYETEDGYAYGAQLFLYGLESYLYVEQPIDIIPIASQTSSVRMVLMAIFVLLLAFAASSAVSGWISKPIVEMTKKANRLAQGDFSVDFHGASYSSEMVELAETLNFARDELLKTDKMQKELIANVSHDFKTPLTMIKAYASMIMEISGDVPEKRNKHAQVIVDEADRLATLVGDVLDLSKLQSGIEVLKKNVFDMSSYTYEVLDRFAYLKDTQGYVFEVDVDEDLYTCADELKIGQVLYNLIGNAVNYTGEDKKVYVRLKKETENVFRFSVTDTGAGIKAEEINEIWDRYYRSSETHKRPVKGMGLGLSIVKTILTRHELIFGVDSEVGKGSTFYVLFPIAKEKGDTEAQQNA